MMRHVLSLIGATLVFHAPLPIFAQDLPPAREVIGRHIEAIGGRDAALAGFTFRGTGDIEIVGAGISGAFEIVVAEPGLMLTTVEIPGFGVARSGFDGEVAWSVDPFQGARILGGEELADVQAQTNPLFTIRDASLFEEVETVARTEMAGTPCYRVRLLRMDGHQTFDCYAVDTGLLVGTVNALGVTTTVADYRAVEDLLMPMRISIEAMGMSQVVTLSSVALDGIDPEQFALPAEIRALTGAR